MNQVVTQEKSCTSQFSVNSETLKAADAPFVLRHAGCSPKNAKLRTGIPGVVRSNISEAAICKVINDQLMRLDGDDVDRIVSSFPKEVRALAEEALRVISSSASLERLGDLLKFAEEKVGVNGINAFTRGAGSLTDILYYMHKKGSFDSSNFRTGTALTCNCLILDDHGTAALRSNPDLALRVVEGEVNVILPLGYHGGITPFNAPLPSQIAEKVAQILRDSQIMENLVQGQDGTQLRVETLHEIIREVLYCNAFCLLNTALGSHGLSIEPRCANIHVHFPLLPADSQANSIGKQIQENLNGSQELSADNVQKITQKLPEQYRPLASEVLVQQSCALSARSIAASLKQLVQRVERKAQAEQIPPDQIYIYVPSTGKSYVYIANTLAQQAGIPPERMIPYNESGTIKNLPENSLCIVADDLSGSGSSLHGAVSAVQTAEFKGHLLIMPLVATRKSIAPDGYLGLLTNPRVQIATAIPVDTYKETDLYKHADGDARDFLKWLQCGSGYNDNGLSVSMPYMAPDNNTHFFGGVVAPNLLIKGSESKNDSYTVPSHDDIRTRLETRRDTIVTEAERIRSNPEAQDDFSLLYEKYQRARLTIALLASDPHSSLHLAYEYLGKKLDENVELVVSRIERDLREKPEQNADELSKQWSTLGSLKQWSTFESSEQSGLRTRIQALREMVRERGLNLLADQPERVFFLCADGEKNRAAVRPLSELLSGAEMLIARADQVGAAQSIRKVLRGYYRRFGSGLEDELKGQARTASQQLLIARTSEDCNRVVAQVRSLKESCDLLAKLHDQIEMPHARRANTRRIKREVEAIDNYTTAKQNLLGPGIGSSHCDCTKRFSDFDTKVALLKQNALKLSGMFTADVTATIHRAMELTLEDLGKIQRELDDPNLSSARLKAIDRDNKYLEDRILRLVGFEPTITDEFLESTHEVLSKLSKRRDAQYSAEVEEIRKRIIPFGKLKEAIRGDAFSQNLRALHYIYTEWSPSAKADDEIRKLIREIRSEFESLLHRYAGDLKSNRPDSKAGQILKELAQYATAREFRHVINASFPEGEDEEHVKFFIDAYQLPTQLEQVTSIGSNYRRLNENSPDDQRSLLINRLQLIWEQRGVLASIDGSKTSSALGEVITLLWRESQTMFRADFEAMHGLLTAELDRKHTITSLVTERTLPLIYAIYNNDSLFRALFGEGDEYQNKLQTEVKEKFREEVVEQLQSEIGKHINQVPLRLLNLSPLLKPCLETYDKLTSLGVIDESNDEVEALMSKVKNALLEGANADFEDILQRVAGPIADDTATKAKEDIETLSTQINWHYERHRSDGSLNELAMMQGPARSLLTYMRAKCSLYSCSRGISDFATYCDDFKEAYSRLESYKSKFPNIAQLLETDMSCVQAALDHNADRIAAELDRVKKSDAPFKEFMISDLLNPNGFKRVLKEVQKLGDVDVKRFAEVIGNCDELYLCLTEKAAAEFLDCVTVDQLRLDEDQFEVFEQNYLWPMSGALDLANSMDDETGKRAKALIDSALKKVDSALSDECSDSVMRSLRNVYNGQPIEQQHLLLLSRYAKHIQDLIDESRFPGTARDIATSLKLLEDRITGPNTFNSQVLNFRGELSAGNSSSREADVIRLRDNIFALVDQMGSLMENYEDLSSAKQVEKRIRAICRKAMRFTRDYVRADLESFRNAGESGLAGLVTDERAYNGYTFLNTMSLELASRDFPSFKFTKEFETFVTQLTELLQSMRATIGVDKSDQVYKVCTIIENLAVGSDESLMVLKRALAISNSLGNDWNPEVRMLKECLAEKVVTMLEADPSRFDRLRPLYNELHEQFFSSSTSGDLYSRWHNAIPRRASSEYWGTRPYKEDYYDRSMFLQKRWPYSSPFEDYFELNQLSMPKLQFTTPKELAKEPVSKSQLFDIFKGLWSG